MHAWAATTICESSSLTDSPGMPDDFPRIDLSEREDAEHVFALIRKHALRLVKQELSKDGMGEDSEALAACQKSIDGWISSAKARLEPNLSINGMAYSEGTQTQPFDQALSQRVQHLTERSDTLTAQVIAARKSMPARRAAAMDERYKVIEKRQSEEEAKRRQTEEEEAARRTHGGSSHPELALERADEVAETLQCAVGDIENLAVTLLEQSSSAHEQAKFVKRLRTMSASFD